MLFLLYSKYDWIPGKTESGKIVYRHDTITALLGFLIGGNVLAVVGWKLLADEEEPETAYVLFGIAAVLFVISLPFAFHRRRLTFDPAGRTVKLAVRGILGRREWTASYDEVTAEMTRPVGRPVYVLKVSISGQTADIADAVLRSSIDEVIAEFEADTGMKVTGGV